MRRPWLPFCALVACLASAAFAATQTDAPFALGRIDQRQGYDTNYEYAFDGKGVRIYVVDTGVNAVGDLTRGHLKMGPFISTWQQRQRELGHSGAEIWQPSCADHGTKVASVAAGSVYGPARGATIVDVRVGACKNAGEPLMPRDVLDALKAIADNHPGGAGVVNLSLRFTHAVISQTEETELTNAVLRLRERGLVVVISATEDGVEACTKTALGQYKTMPGPLGVHEGVITVSASDRNDFVAVDGTATAGKGACVDVFAPTGTTATNYAGGASLFQHTSCSTGVVSGVAAIILQQYPWMKPADVERAIRDNATNGVMKGDLGGSPNRLVYTRLPILTPNSTYIAAGQTKTMTVTSSEPAGTSYYWTVAHPGMIDGSVTGPSATLRAPATCGPNTFDANVKVTTPSEQPGNARWGYLRQDVFGPTAQWRYEYYTTPGTPVELAVPLTGVAPWTVTWSDNVVTTHTSSPAKRTVTPTTSTSYGLKELRDATGCPALYSVSISVNVTNCAAPSATITAPAAMKASQTGTASVPQTAGATYNWTVENGTIWNGQGTNSIQYTVGCSGTATVRATVTASCGTPAQGSASTTIWEPRLSIGGDATIVAGEATYINASFSGMAPWQITWSDGVRLTSLLSSSHFYEVSPPVTTTYTATFKDKNGCTGPVFGSATVTVE